MKVAYLDCYSGISGDMTLGALVDAGLSAAELRRVVELLPIDGYLLTIESTTNRGIAGTRVRVDLLERSQPHRRLSNIREILESADLSEAVKTGAISVFQRLAEAEATVHGSDIESVEFHEVGGVDAIIDIVGSVWGFEQLGIERIFYSTLPTGYGRVRSAHGLIPIPAPATVELARRAGATLVAAPIETELVTPTGAAIATTLGISGQPPMTIEKIGYGFGQKELPWPNALRVWIGEMAASDVSPIRDRIVLLETNIDDMTPELLGAAMERLLAEGALDVYFTPIQMKKNRPATMLSVIAPLGQEENMAACILAHTSTLGIRVRHVERYKAERWISRVATPWGHVRIKVRSFEGRINGAPEYDDCLTIARERGIPIADVYEAARLASVQQDLRPI